MHVIRFAAQCLFFACFLLSSGSAFGAAVLASPSLELKDYSNVPNFYGFGYTSIPYRTNYAAGDFIVAFTSNTTIDYTGSNVESKRDDNVATADVPMSISNSSGTTEDLTADEDNENSAPWANGILDRNLRDNNLAVQNSATSLSIQVVPEPTSTQSFIFIFLFVLGFMRSRR